MYEFSTELYQLCQAELSKIEKNEHHTSSLNMIDLCFSAIQKVKTELKKTLFKNSLDEVDFFKKIFPPLLAKAKYYVHRADLERTELLEPTKTLRNLVLDKKKEINKYNQENEKNISYILEGNGHRDIHYFTRSQTQFIAKLRSKDVDPVLICPDSTIGYADYLAFERLSEDIQAYLDEGKSFLTGEQPAKKLRWTGTHDEFLELIFCLCKLRCFNDGKVSEEIVVRHFQKYFDVDLGIEGVEIEFRKAYGMRLTMILFNDDYYELTGEVLETEYIVKLRELINSQLRWTESVTDLVELIYTLQLVGSFNHGKATIKDIAQYFEYCFNIYLGNTSSTYQRILNRKSGPTNFLERLRDWA